MRFERLHFPEVPWGELACFDDRSIYQSREWIDFVVETQHAEPVVARIWDGKRTVGFFTGLIIQRFGVRILGSPFPGWTTLYMGFNLMEGVSRPDALRELASFAYTKLRCVHVEVCDRNFIFADGQESGFLARDSFTYETDLTRSEEQLLAHMAPDCRNKIRKAAKTGLVIEEASDLEFATDYHNQLIEVFARQRLVPTYGRDRVEKLIKHLLPTGNLLLLRAREPSGKCIATGIYVGSRRYVVFWGNASHRSSIGANEAIHWYAMRYWKRKGAALLDWGTGGTYKEKYGVTPLVVPIFAKSRFRFLQLLRDRAQQAFGWKQRVLGRFVH